MADWLIVVCDADSKYQWGSGHWTETTWSKVYVVAAVHELGFHIIFSDADVTWYKVGGFRPRTRI